MNQRRDPVNASIDVLVSGILIWQGIRMFLQRGNIPADFVIIYCVFAVIFIAGGAWFMLRALKILLNKEERKDN
ncbi:MAG: hypothetical protein IJJ29_03755 [Solobacterium sp.]|nr:hypothetical protein [Solobacterium sp.]